MDDGKAFEVNVETIISLTFGSLDGLLKPLQLFCNFIDIIEVYAHSLKTTFQDRETNVVNFKLLQTILLILAHRLNMLEQEVDINFVEKEDFGEEMILEDEYFRSKSLLYGDDGAHSEEKGLVKGTIEKGKTSDVGKITTTVYNEEDKELKGKKSKAQNDKRSKLDKLSLGKSGERMAKDLKIDKSREKREKKSKLEKLTFGESQDETDKKVTESMGKIQNDHDFPIGVVISAIPSSSEDSGDDRKKMIKTRHAKERSYKMRQAKKEAMLKERVPSDDSVISDETTSDDDERSGKKKKTKRRKASDDTYDDGAEYDGKGKTKPGKLDAKHSGISISEPGHKSDKVSKGVFSQMKRGSIRSTRSTRSSSIELVTRSQFETLQRIVKHLQQNTEPVPMPSMPDNTNIKKALAKGSTTLPGAMEAMQLNARVKAAELALIRMSDLLTMIEESETFPPELFALIKQLQKDQKHLTRLMTEGDKVLNLKSSKSIVAPEKSMKPAVSTKLDVTKSQAGVSKITQVGDMPSSATMTQPSIQLPPANPFVTPTDLSEAVENMKHMLLKNMTSVTESSTASAEHAINTVNTVVDKLAIALSVNQRIDDLDALTKKHAEQMSGFDAGLKEQLARFKEQVRLMHLKLEEKLQNMASKNLYQSTAVAELRTGHNRMELKVDQTMHHLTSLVVMHKQLDEENKKLQHWVSIVLEEKVDREELITGLKEKVDKSRLIGLLMEDAFEVSRQELNQELEKCFEMFNERNTMWTETLKELKLLSANKAQYLELYTLRAYVTEHLKDIQATLCRLELLMGDPKVAMLTRKLSRDTYCGPCMVAAQMELFDKTFGKPPELPALALDFTPKEKERPIFIHRPPDLRNHISNRWVGGSHTIIREHTTKEKPLPYQLQTVPVRRYADTAPDGHIYMFEEELQPCIECENMSMSTAKNVSSQQSRSTAIKDDDQSIRDKYTQENASIVSIHSDLSYIIY